MKIKNNQQTEVLKVWLYTEFNRSAKIVMKNKIVGFRGCDFCELQDEIEFFLEQKNIKITAMGMTFNSLLGSIYILITYEEEGE